MAVTNDRVTVELEAKVGDYNAKISGAQRASDRSFQKIGEGAKKAETAVERSFRRQAAAAGLASTALRSFGTAFVGALSIGAISQGIGASLTYAQTIGKVAAQAGITAERLQELRYAAMQTGGSAEALDRGLVALEETLGKAAMGSKSETEMLKALGVTAKDVGAAIPQIADALAKVDDPAQRAALRVKLFSEAGRDLGGMLDQGSAGINKLSAAAREFQGVLSNKEIQDADVTAKKLDQLRLVLATDVSSAVIKNKDAVLALVGAMVTLVTWAGKAVQAYMRFKASQGIIQETQAASSIWNTPEERQKHLDNVERFKGMLRDNTPSNNPAVRNDAVWDKKLGRFVNPESQSAGVNQSAIDKLLAPAPPKGRGATGPSPEEIEARFLSDLARIQGDRLNAELDLATEADRRLKLQGQLSDIEYAARLADIEAEKHYSAERKKQLISALNELYGRDDKTGETITSGPLAKADARAFEKQLADEARSLAETQNQIERDLIEATLDVTDGRTARRDLELRLLDLAFADERRALEDQATDKTISEAKRREAELRLAQLDNLKGAAQAGVIRQNEGPVDTYLRSIPDTAEEINDALENVAVNGLKDLEDGFGRAAAKALGLKGALGEVVAQMIRLVAQQLILSAVGGGGGGAGGLLSSIFGGFRAAGGPVAAGKAYVVGEKGPELLQMGVSSGNIVPNHALASRGGAPTTVNQYFNLDARYGVTTPELIDYVNRTAVTAGQAAVKQSRADLKAIGRPRM